MFVARVLANTSAVLLVLLFNLLNLLQQQAAASTTKKRNCDPIGRVLSGGDRTLPKGSLLCKGDRLNPSSGKIVKVLCYQNQKVLQLGKGAVDDSGDKCSPQTIQVFQCTSQSRSNCPKPKNPGSDEPTIISPYSSLILNPRPSISWHRVRGASSYVVRLNGKGVNWSRQTRDLTLAYPPQEKALSVGTAFKLTVLAMSGEEPQGASSQAVNMLPSSIAQLVLAIVSQIKKLNLPPDEQARDLDSAYMSQKLLTEAIEVLKARVDVGTTSPTIHRLLGDRYLEAGLPLDAEQAYTSASTLASRADNSAELAKAQTGLKRAQAHRVNNIKGDQ
jgi:hypothetical protein